MTRATHNTIQRIHRDREALRLVLKRRLARVLRDMAGDAIILACLLGTLVLSWHPWR